MAFCVGISHTASGQDTTELWKWTADADIRMQEPMPDGDLLVASEKSMARLSAATGHVMWTRTDMAHQKWVTVNWGPTSIPIIDRDDEAEYLSFFDRYIRLETRVPGQRALKKSGRRGVRLVDDRDNGRLLLIHPDSGKDAFDSWALGIKPVRGSCVINDGALLVAWGGDDKRPNRAVAFELSTAKVAWTTELPLLRDITCHPENADDHWYVHGRTDKGQRRVAAIASSTGRVRWTSADLGKYDEDIPPRLVAGGSVVVVSADRVGPVGIDARDGSTKWRASLVKGESAPQIVRRDDRVFIANDKALVVVDVESGAVKWRRDTSTIIVAELDSGLLTRSGGVELLRYDTGQPVWTSPARRGSLEVMYDDTLVQVVGKSLQSMDLRTGGAREIGAMEFQGKEAPASIELLGDMIVVMSNQNVAGFDRNGGRKHQEYYVAPGLLSGTEQFLAGALAAGLTAGGMAVAGQQARAGARDAAFVRGGSGTGIGFYRVYSPDVGTRYKATTDSDRYVFMFTERPDQSGRQGFSIVRIDKASGREQGRLWSEERRPIFSADGRSGRLYMRTGEQTLTAFGFALREP